MKFGITGIKTIIGRPAPFGWLKRAFGRILKPAVNPVIGTEVPLGGGCAAGTIMPDGTVVRCEGEPPIARGKPWFRQV